MLFFCSEVPRGKMGTLVIGLPLPPGCMNTLWKNNARYVDSYLSKFPGNYLTGDAGFQDADGYVSVMVGTFTHTHIHVAHAYTYILTCLLSIGANR